MNKSTATNKQQQNQKQRNRLMTVTNVTKQRKTRGKNRSPEEIIQARLDEIAKIQARQILKGGEDNPILAPLVAALKSEETARNACLVKLKGNNSFKNRLEIADLKLTWIKAQQAFTIAQSVASQARKEYFRVALQGMMTGEITEENVQVVLDSAPYDSSLSALEQTMTDAHEVYKAAVKAAKVAKKPRKSKDILSDEANQEATETAKAGNGNRKKQKMMVVEA